MAKSDNEAEFVSALRRQSGTVPMKLNTPPKRNNKPWDEVLSDTNRTQQQFELAERSNDAGLGDADPRRGFFVAVANLLAHPWNARVHRSPERIRAIAHSMAATRQRHPISVVPTPEHAGKYFVVDGETRWKGAQQLKWKEIWAVQVDVDPANPVAFYVESFKHTDATKPISAIDQGLRWSQLIQQNAASAESIAHELELSKATVSKMLAYSKFSPQVLEFMHENSDRFPYSIASLLAPLVNSSNDSDDVILSMCKKIVDEDFSRRSVEALIKQKTAEIRLPRRSTVAARTIKVDDRPIGYLRTYENGNVEMKVSGDLAPIDRMNQLAELLQIAADALVSDSDDFADEVISRLKEVKPDHD